MTLIEKHIEQGKIDARKDWENDTIEEYFDETTPEGVAYAKAYSDEIKLLSIS